MCRMKTGLWREFTMCSFVVFFFFDTNYYSNSHDVVDVVFYVPLFAVLIIYSRVKWFYGGKNVARYFLIFLSNQYANQNNPTASHDIIVLTNRQNKKKKTTNNTTIFRISNSFVYTFLFEQFPNEYLFRILQCNRDDIFISHLNEVI